MAARKLGLPVRFVNRPFNIQPPNVVQTWAVDGFYMVNCSHPSNFIVGDEVTGTQWGQSQFLTSVT